METRQRTARGLTEEEALRSRRERGENRLSEKKQVSLLLHFLGNLNDPIIRILLLALGVQLILVLRGGDLYETLGIGLSIFLATMISTLSERKSEAAFRRLSEECGGGTVRVWRNGVLCQRPIEELVVGDRMLLGAGEQIPADARLISGELRVDQSAMTGEAKEILKRPAPFGGADPSCPSALLRGCPILGGEGEAEVVAVGDATFLGGISREIQSGTRESPLRLRLGKLATQISRFGYVAALLVCLAYFFNVFVLDSGLEVELILGKLQDPVYLFEHLLKGGMLGLTVVVMSVPEGLPMMVAVVLSANTRRMIRDNVLVRTPVGIESAGSMDLLFTDKTGTLTEGIMRVSSFLGGDGRAYTPEELRRNAPRLLERYALSALFNTSATLGEGGAMGGNATERALLDFLSPREASLRATVTQKLPFDSERKYSAATLAAPYSVTLIKGAPELLLPHLRYRLRADGGAEPFAPTSLAFAREIEKKTAEGARVLLLAEGQRLPAGGFFGDLTLLGAVVLEDRLRPEAADSVRILREAGIRTVMITGDHKTTARRIAASCGIIQGKEDLVLTSEELRAYSDRELAALLPRLSVLARALPSDKSRLVRVAEEAGRVVGMTGDGINDAPALRAADVGFAMGSGTSVAKEAGDVIILDNNLSSIAKAVLYGRTVFKSIRKFITLQLTMNFCAVGVSMIGPFIGFDSPVTVTQMLWINLIMDTLGGLAFAGEAPVARTMKEPPKRRDEPILNGYMLHQIAFLGGYAVSLCLAFLLSPSLTGRFRAHPDQLVLLSAFFSLFIFTSVLECFCARTDRLRPWSGLGRNSAFLLIMAAVSFVQLLFVYLGGSVLRTVPLTPEELSFTALLSLSVLPVELLRKLLWRLTGHRTGF